MKTEWEACSGGERAQGTQKLLFSISFGPRLLHAKIVQTETHIVEHVRLRLHQNAIECQISSAIVPHTNRRHSNASQQCSCLLDIIVLLAHSPMSKKSQSHAGVLPSPEDVFCGLGDSAADIDRCMTMYRCGETVRVRTSCTCPWNLESKSARRCIVLAPKMSLRRGDLAVDNREF